MDWATNHPIPAGAVILGLCWIIKTIITLVWPFVWKNTSNEGLVTQKQLDDALAKVHAEEKACQNHLAAELAAIKKALTEGDGCFAGLAESRSDIALSLRDLCAAVKKHFKLDDKELDCERLRRWIIGGEKGRVNHD